VPVPIDLDAVPGFDHTLTDSGASLRVVSDDGAELPHEVERLSTSPRMLWALAPEVTPQGATLWVYYGHSGATTTEDPDTLWAAQSHLVVVHADGARDSTGNTTSTSSTNVGDATGLVGPARTFGSASSTQSHAAAALQTTADFTLELWFRLDADFDAQSASSLLLLSRFLDNDNNLHVALAGADYAHASKVDGALVVKLERPSSQFYYVWSARSSWQRDTWYHLALTVDASDQAGTRLYLDGELASHTLGGTANPSDLDYAADLVLGAGAVDTLNVSAGSLPSAQGDIDELRVRAGAKGLERVRLETRLQRKEQLTYGAAEAR
jgi:hypothetical protein